METRIVDLLGEKALSFIDYVGWLYEWNAGVRNLVTIGRYDHIHPSEIDEAFFTHIQEIQSLLSTHIMKVEDFVRPPKPIAHEEMYEATDMFKNDMEAWKNHQPLFEGEFEVKATTTLFNPSKEPEVINQSLFYQNKCLWDCKITMTLNTFNEQTKELGLNYNKNYEI